MIEQLDSTLFDWLKWRAYSIKELGIFCRYADITSARGEAILKKYAIGYCRGETVICRPKIDHIALMCFKDGEEFWFHLRKNEFNQVFKEDL